ncbi:MAG TPA: SDR family oxidoreductase [Sphingomonas sp.]|nr:SDR family oxidoreductase [Sphingomonas sp.]
MTKNLDQASQDAYRNLHLLGFGRPEDVSNAATFLMCDGARWITGSSLVVDGGYMAR